MELVEKLEPEGLDREEVRESLIRLEDEGLVQSQEATEGVEDFGWHHITERGLSAERQLRRLELVT